MGRRKSPDRENQPLNKEEEGFFRNALSDLTAFDGAPAVEGLDGILLKIWLDDKYTEWCEFFLSSLKNPKYCHSLNVLRLFRTYNVRIGYTVRGIFDYVRMELETQALISSLTNFNRTRKLSHNRLETIIGKTEELSKKIKEEARLCAPWDEPNEPEDDAPNIKEALLLQIKNALQALNEIYQYEISHSDVESFRNSQSLARASHLRRILPPDVHFKGQKWWSELARLMTSTAWIIVHEMKGSALVGIGYSGENLRDLDRNFTPEDIERLREEFCKDMPDFFTRIELESPSQVLEELKQAAAFSPSANARDAIRLAVAWISKTIRWERISE